MFQPSPKKAGRFFSSRHLSQSLVFAFAAGALNVGGFLACGRFVTHVTGFATYFGAESGLGNWSEAFGLLSIPVFFFLGALLAGWFLERRLQQGLKPWDDLLLGLVVLQLGASAFLGLEGYFGDFGLISGVRHVYLLLAMLSTSSGLMNALISSASRSQLRSTHLTGITTDLGLGVMRLLYLKDKAGRMDEKRINGARAGVILFFILGSATGAFIFGRWGFGGFYAVGAFVLVDLILLRSSRRV